MSEEEQANRAAKSKGEANWMIFSEKNVRSLRPKRRQYMVWGGGMGRDSGEVCRGLGILVSPMGAKSYRSMFYFPAMANPTAAILVALMR